MGLRERKKARTRESLAEAALALFEARGFEATTIDDIAAAADVSRRTFFRYFPTKEQAAFPHSEARLERFEALLSQAAGAEPWDRARDAFLALATDFTAGRDALLRQNRVVAASPTLTAYELQVDRAWEDRLAQALRRDVDGPDFEARVAAGAIIGAVRVALRTWFDADAGTDLAALGRKALGLLERGLG